MILIFRCKNYFSKIIVPITQQVKIKKKKNADLNDLKKSLQIQAAKKRQNKESIYEEISHRQVYKHMDSSMENFFHKRQYNIQNFNFLLNVLGEQNKLEQITGVLDKMDALNISPNEQTYNYIIRIAARCENIELTEKYFTQFKKKYQVNKFVYTTLMLCYCRTKNPVMADSILYEMIQQKLVPDIATFTTLINTHLKSHNLARCWELNKIVEKQNIPLDQTYIGVMMQVHAATHDAEKAIKLYNQHFLESDKVLYVQTINSYFKALASRIQYCPRVIELFFKRISTGQFINVSTCLYALKACSLTANIKSAVQMLKVMRTKGIEPNKYIYNTLLRCYAAACNIPEISEDTVDLYISDAWKILQETINKNMVDTSILNNLLYIYVQALRIQEVEGLVLPLYSKFGLQKDQFTIDYILHAYVKKDDMAAFMRVWTINMNELQQKKNKFMELYGKQKLALEMKKQTFRPTFHATCNYLDASIKLMDMNQVIKALQMFKQMGRLPKTKQLKFLGQLKDLPEEILVQLHDFGQQFGRAKGTRKFSPVHEDPQNL